MTNKTTNTEYLKLAEAPEKNAVDLDIAVSYAANNAGYIYKLAARKQDQPDNGTGYMIFAEKEFASEMNSYGEHYFAANGDGAVSIWDIADELQKIADEYYGEKIDWNIINPEDIMFEPGIWGDMEFMQHLFDCHENVIYNGVKTNNGLILFTDCTVMDKIKSADPVVYDENGNVIPLSERFGDECNE